VRGPVVSAAEAGRLISEDSNLATSAAHRLRSRSCIIDGATALRELAAQVMPDGDL
jgi:hypothetical protein